MSTSKMKYKRHNRISHNVDSQYDIVFDVCTPVIDGVPQKDKQLLMRYTKNGHTVNNAPAFDEIDMMKAIIELYNSTLLSSKAKEILRKGITD